MNQMPAIACTKLDFRYAGANTNAIEGVNLEIKAGEFVVLSGSSGSGKTTLARCLNGLAPHFWEGQLGGEIRLMGENIDGKQIGEIGGILSTVFQDPRSQFFMTNTDNEIAFGCVNRGWNRKETLQRIKATYTALSMTELQNRSLFELSSGQLQKIAIGSVFAINPDIYLFDEPSANLDFQATQKLAGLLCGLKKCGKTVIVIEHRLFYLTGLLDRLVVFKDGCIRADYPRNRVIGLTEAELRDLGLRALHLHQLPSQVKARALPEPNTTRHTLELRNLGFYYRSRLRHHCHQVFQIASINATAHSGEVVAVVGENGVGKTTLARILCGLNKESAGEIWLDGILLSPRQRLGTIRLVAQDSDYQLFSDSVASEFSLERKCPEQAPHDLWKQLGLADFVSHHPQALSRGQKQRVTIACALASAAPVICFDEPTSGLDRDNMSLVAGLITEIARQGRVIILISHDLEFLALCATRIWFMKDGQLVDDCSFDTHTAARLLGAARNKTEVEA